MEKIKKSTLAAMASSIIFGFSFMFSLVVLQQMQHFTMLAVRFIIAFLAMTLMLIIRVARFDFQKPKMPLLALGLLQPVLYFTLETLGLSQTNSVITGSIIAIVPVAGMLMAAIFLGEKFTPAQLAFGLISVLGVVLVSISGRQSGGHFLGIFLLLGAVFAATGYSLLSRKFATRYTAFERTYAMFFVGSIVFTGIALWVSGDTLVGQLAEAFSNTRVVACLFYLAVVSSVLAFFMMNYASEHLPISKLTSFANLSSVVSMVAGAVFLGEPMGFLHLLGCALILLGVFFTNRAPVVQG